jgi:mRNA interferase HigB
MRVISRKAIREFLDEHHGSDSAALDRWYKLAKGAAWSNFAELRSEFPSADQVGRFVVFNVGGNKYRVATFINFRRQKLFIRAVMTHGEYDQDTWKGR